MYFNKLGTTEYNGIVIPNILKRIVANPNLSTTNLVEQYTIIENETPESLSYNYYGVVDYYWVIMLINNIKSRYFDWPMNNDELGNHITEKYGNTISLFFHDTVLSNASFSLCDVASLEIQIVGITATKNVKVLKCDRNLNKLEIEKPKEITPSSFITIKKMFNETNKYLGVITQARTVYQNENAVHHFDYYIDPINTNTTYNSRQLLATYIGGNIPKETVSNQQYESELNEKKRNIILIKPEYISLFVSEFEKIASLE